MLIKEKGSGRGSAYVCRFSPLFASRKATVGEELKTADGHLKLALQQSVN